MKNILFILLSLLIVSCNKKEDDNVVPAKTVTRGTVRIEIMAEKSTASSNFKTTAEIYVKDGTPALTTYNSLLNKSNSIIKEYTNISSDQVVTAKASTDICDVPMTIKVFFNGTIIKSYSSQSTCTDDLNGTTRLPDNPLFNN